MTDYYRNTVRKLKATKRAIKLIRAVVPRTLSEISVRSDLLFLLRGARAELTKALARILTRKRRRKPQMQNKPKPKLTTIPLLMAASIAQLEETLASTRDLAADVNETPTMRASAEEMAALITKQIAETQKGLASRLARFGAPHSKPRHDNRLPSSLSDGRQPSRTKQ